MFNISKYLEKFKRKLEYGEELNNSIIKSVNKNTGIILKINDFEIKNNTIYIKSSPAVKNKIFIFKENIIKELYNISNKKFTDIK